MNLNLKNTAYLASVVVHNTGELLRESWPTNHPEQAQDQERIGTSLKSKYDKLLLRELIDLYPQHNFVTQKENINNGSEYIWHISGLDGAKYFTRGIPLFAVSVGLTKEDTPILGVVYNTISHQMYWCYQGLKTIYRNYEPVPQPTTQQNKSLEQAIIAFEFSGSQITSLEEKDWIIEKSFQLSSRSYRGRAFGCASLAMTWVGTGGLDIFVDLTGNPNDPAITAGLAILNTSGGYWKKIGVGFSNPRLVAGKSQKLVDQVSSLLLTPIN